jgi:hypothetical protein
MLRCKSSSSGVVVESNGQWKLPTPTASSLKSTHDQHRFLLAVNRLTKAAASAAAAALIYRSSGSDDDIMMRVSNRNKSIITCSALTKLSAIATATLAVLEAPL